MNWKIGRSRPRYSAPLRPKTLLGCERLESRLALALSLSGVADRLELGGVPTPLTGMTVEAWVHRSDETRCETVLNGRMPGSFWFGLCNDGVWFRSNDNSTAQSGETKIPRSAWTHIAATWEIGGRQKIFVNGDLDSDVPAGAGPQPILSTDTLLVGVDIINPGGAFEFYDAAFQGRIAEVRLWEVARTAEQIRQTMNLAIEDTRNGLLVDLHLDKDLSDTAGHRTAIAHAQAQLINELTPALTAVSHVDANFNLLPEARFASAAVSIPTANVGYLFGGTDIAFAFRREIMAIDMGAGRTQTVADLPLAAASQAAAYVPESNSVFIFGGAAAGGQLNTVVKYDVTTGTVTTLAATLPVALSRGVAVWQPAIQRVVLLGGYDAAVAQATDAVLLFDPANETISPANFTLPTGRYNAAAAYSPLTDRIYLFGGHSGELFPAFAVPKRETFEIQVNVDGSGSATHLPIADLPVGTRYPTAIEDPKSHLIYVLGGDTEYVQAFDPIAQKSWRTMIRMPRASSGVAIDRTPLNGNAQAVFYSPRSRHALVVGGQLGLAAQRKMWRVPLGDGAAVPLERWDFPTPIGAHVTAIDGDDKRVVFGTDGAGPFVAEITHDGTRVAFGSGAFNVNDVSYHSSADQTWVATSLAGAWRFPGSSASPNRHVGQGGGIEDINTNRIYALDDSGSHFATDRGLWSHNRFGSGYSQHMSDPTNAYTHVVALAGNPLTGDIWGVTQTSDSLSENTWDLPELRRVAFDDFGSGSEANYGSVCGTGALAGELREYKDMVFDPSGNLWIVGTGGFGISGVNDKAICYIPANNIPAGANRFFSFNGEHANDASVDAEGRVWVAFNSWNGAESHGVETGGLTAWESSRADGTTTTDYNWRNAPLGSRRALGGFGSFPPTWDSGYSQVGAVDEKVWAARGANGELATIAQRWGQIDGGYLDQTVVDKIFTLRGRVFFTSAFDLTVLQPDGATYDSRLLPGSKVVFGDSRGNTWVGAAGGIVPTAGSLQLYLPSGWDPLADRAGSKPSGAIRAIVESRDNNLNDAEPGPIWIGGDSGLTLFDRNRFVATFTAANSTLPSSAVTALVVDRQDRLWIGTSAGLAMLSADRTAWATWTTAHGLPNNAIHELAEMGDGRIAVSTANGLAFFDGTTFAAQSPPVAAVNLPLTVDEVGRLWAGSAVLTATGWKGYWYTNSGLKSSTVSDNAADGADRVWFSHAPHPGVSVRGAYLPPLKDYQPTISDISPRFATASQTVWISGDTFGGNSAEVAVVLGSGPIEIVSVENTRIEVRVTDETTSGPVTVTRGGRSVSYGADATNTIFCAVPQVRSIGPVGGSVGMEVTITGTNFDPDATIRFGDGPARKANPISPTVIKAIVTPEDVSGTITVNNHCADAADVSDASFRKIPVAISEIALNQGLSYYGIVQDKPTHLQAYLSTNGPLGDGEHIEIDEVEFLISEPSGYTTLRTFDYGNGIEPKSLAGLPSDVDRKDIANSFNVSPITFGESGVAEMKTVLRRRGHVVAQLTGVVEVAPNLPTRVLLVPYMMSGSTPEQLAYIRGLVETKLDDLRQRVMPFGTAVLHWSPEVVYDNDFFALDNVIDFYDKSHALDRARRHWNESHSSALDVDIAFGIVDLQLVTPGSAPGFAFSADLSEMLNTLPLDALDALCDIGDSIISVVGLSDDDGCSLDIPLNVAWAAGGPLRISEDEFKRQVVSTIGHEIGHINGLVKPYAYNGSFGDNISHSVNDEIGGSADCSNGPTVFDWAKSLYNQPGVVEPIINPLASPSGAQWYPHPTGNWSTPRAKAIMSYACGAYSNNSFFEPVDVLYLNPTMARVSGDFRNVLMPAGGSPAADTDGGAAMQQRTAAAPAAPPAASSITPRPNPGPRLHVSGTVNAVAATGEIRQAEVFGEHGPLTPSFATEFSLVQLDAVGNELARIGLYPIAAAEPNGDPTKFFAATMVRRPGLASIELRQGATILDTFAAGSELPVIEIIGPLAGEEFLDSEMPVSFSATDADGDSLSIVIEYSIDDGASWTPVGNATQGGTVAISTASLAGAAGTARVRVSGSDGLNTSSAVSGAFTVAAQPPRPYISGANEVVYLYEGQHLALSGGALDNQDGTVADDQLRWSSDVAGLLGTGRVVSVPMYRVGWHTITLEATNSQGLTTFLSYTVHVEPDYDFDGIGDAAELAAGINPLSALDAYADGDGDGLSYLVELHRGLDPANPDSDFDGRTDDTEVVDGTNPLGADEQAVPNQLVVSPTRVTLAADLGAQTPLPQQTIGILSRGATDWSVTSTVDWLEASATSGTTPDSLLLRVQAYELPDGVHTAELTFASVALGHSVTVPLSITVANRDAWFDVSGDGRATPGDCASVQSNVGAIVGDPQYQLRYDIDRDGVVDAQDFGTCSNVVGTTTLLGDFDADGDVDDRDIDLLFAEVRAGTHSPQFDLTADTLVDQADATHLVETILHSHFGDANLDGFVDRVDVTILARNYGFALGSSWARGDYNGDLRTDLHDLAILQANLTAGSPPSPAASVPAAITASKRPRAIVEAEHVNRRALVSVAFSPLEVANAARSRGTKLQAPRRRRVQAIDMVFDRFSHNHRPSFENTSQ